MTSSTQDPFYLIRQELQASVNDLQTKFAQWSSTSPSHHNKHKQGKEIEKMCTSILWQLDEIQNAIEKAMQNPEKFKLTSLELDNRQSWLKTTRRQVKSMYESVQLAFEKTAKQETEYDKLIVQENDKFINNTVMEQEMIIRRQDADLDDMEKAVGRIGVVGKTIHEELTVQHKMLEELDEDMDTTSSKVKAAQKKMDEVMKIASSNWQLITIVALTIVLVILIVLAATL